ncbi:MAG: 30S ribosomal protein S20 [Alphaproteobacteria bacterium MarineAlpha5_Bin2]|jgi:small subunit ribosomal protein S20|nr:30S ribosomal protein S20 [Candidatus Pelagibacter sp.]MCH2541821.1 30S ribosomal protein S20 [Alphaproteobacteria bacterium]MDP7541349.1 30S ribosomal protein S20 [Candidatus Pelagibacter bacterium]PPR54793.1 MAG: 30S ribosomal protein S20 [Alphaproteobacteria bacterium MarineAlpha5_Bin2]PPR56629.1 MAG: 30S ribosomal protein S20 [Alphaproteobacteria bacterium MarineAlpha5_Bin3]|tara:strand:+ start:562 stop:822 length:261 start_codon:yes stop_codon:yes gene_type:complete
MANHKSAKKRTRQALKRKLINSQILSQLKTNINKFTELIKAKNKEEIDKSFNLVNSSLAKATKKGLIKKQYMSRKLSSLSKKTKNI